MSLISFRTGSLGRFLIAGVPTFVLALPLNYALVEWAHMSKEWAYGLVLFFQVTVNFLICRFVVFERGSAIPLWKQYGLFTGGILFFRLADWCLYYVLVQVVGLYYIGVQLFNAGLFSLVKFGYARKIMK